MSLELPSNPDLEQLRTQAKELARALRAGDPAAAARIAAALPHLRGKTVAYRLAHAQTTVAREHGFASWPKLKQRAEQLQRAASRRAVAGAVASAEMEEFRRKDVSEMAATWVSLARQGDLNRLLVTLSVGRQKMLLARDLLAESGQLSVVVDALLIGVRHRKPNVRHLSAHAMDMFADERCMPALLELLDDPVPRVRWIAVHSLVCDDCKVTPFGLTAPDGNQPVDVVGRVIDMALNDPSIQARRHALVALGHFEDERVRVAAEAVLEQETDTLMCRYTRRLLKWLPAKAS